MKRSRELELMREAFARANIRVDYDMALAMENGFLSIRRERYEERQRAKKKRKDAHYRPGRAGSGRETVTTETGLAMLRSGEIPLDGMAKLRGEVRDDSFSSPPMRREGK